MTLYTANDDACRKAIEEDDRDTLEAAYKELHKVHNATSIRNTGQYAPGIGTKREVAQLRSGVIPVSGATVVDGASTSLLLLEDRDDVVSPVNRTLGNVAVQLPKQRITVGADGHLSATVRCHAANWAGLSVVVTSCLLTLKPVRKIARSAVLAPLKESMVRNARGNNIIVERLDRLTVRVRVEEAKDAKPGPIGEVELPGELWALLDARPGDEFDCQMRILLRDVSAEPEPETEGLARSTGELIDDTNMQRIHKRFEEVHRLVSDQDGNISALLHCPRVALATAKQD